MRGERVRRREHRQRARARDNNHKGTKQGDEFHGGDKSNFNVESSQQSVPSSLILALGLWAGICRYEYSVSRMMNQNGLANSEFTSINYLEHRMHTAPPIHNRAPELSYAIKTRDSKTTGATFYTLTDWTHISQGHDPFSLQKKHGRPSHMLGPTSSKGIPETPCTEANTCDTEPPKDTCLVIPVGITEHLWHVNARVRRLKHARAMKV